MTAPKRLAKVAEVQKRHGGYKSAGVGRGWLCWCDVPLSDWWPEGGVGPRESSLDVALRAHLAEALAPLLDEFQAEDEARGAAKVREAVEAASEALLTISAQAVRAAYDDEERLSGHLIDAATRVKAVCNDLRALDAAEKAAVEGASVPTSEREGGNGPDHAGTSERPSDRRTAAQGLRWVDLFGIDPDYGCDHEWLLRPESDTHVCQICGNER